MNIINLQTGEPFDESPRFNHRELAVAGASSASLRQRNLLGLRGTMIGSKAQESWPFAYDESIGALGTRFMIRVPSDNFTYDGLTYERISGRPTIYINWGDSEEDDTRNYTSSLMETPAHTYATAGDYIITIRQGNGNCTGVYINYNGSTESKNAFRKLIYFYTGLKSLYFSHVATDIDTYDIPPFPMGLTNFSFSYDVVVRRLSVANCNIVGDVSNMPIRDNVVETIDGVLNTVRGKNYQFCDMPYLTSLDIPSYTSPTSYSLSNNYLLKHLTLGTVTYTNAEVLRSVGKNLPLDSDGFRTIIKCGNTLDTAYKFSIDVDGTKIECTDGYWHRVNGSWVRHDAA